MPKNTKSSSLIKSHTQLGVIFSIPLLIMAISGAYITFGVRGAPSETEHKPLPVLAKAGDIQAQVLAAQNLWPKAELVAFTKPRKPKENSFIYTLSFNGSNPLLLQQTDTIKIDLTSGKLHSAETFYDKGLLYQLKYSARFLHDGARMPTWYLILLMVSSLVGMAMVGFVFVTFVRKEIILRYKNRSV